MFNGNFKELSKNKKFFASKKMGQNFLINKNIQEKIVNYSNLKSGDYILEIGPGMGAITGILLSHKIHLYAIELDKRLYEYLSNKFSSNRNFHLVNDDAITLDWNTFLTDNEFKLVANLPYSISSALVLKLISYNQVKTAIIMVQKEFAQRLIAKVGSKKYNMFTVLVNIFFDVKFLFDISPKNFNPPPKVMSSLIELTKKANTLIGFDELDELNLFLRLCFSNKRKTLLNNLLPKYSKNLIMNVLNKNKINILIRSEQLDANQLINVMRELRNGK